MFYSVLRCIAYPIVRLLYWFRVTGVENIPKQGKVILCCNHIQMLDVVLLIIACPRRISFMAKEELFRNPLVGWLFRKMGAFPVVRGAASREAINYAVSLIQDGGVLGIFPEGKRCREGRPTKAKSGIAMILSQVDAPVIPAAIYYKDNRRVFARANLHFGEPIPHEVLEMKDNSRDELRRVSSTIMSHITSEWEKING
ncbi:MAG: 1-acyl-sn-glycerol-3-phosphate acyltransferase [Clostridia bacterium]|nr:1-acyl-sn-glycerol-3-phosphate acyltransferase [Clostridia bacterium]